MNQQTLVDNARRQGIKAHLTGASVCLWVKPCQAKAAKELLKGYELSCRVNVERARKPVRRYNNQFDFIKNYPVARKSGSIYAQKEEGTWKNIL